MWAEIKAALNSTTGAGMETLDRIIAESEQGAYYNYMADKYGVNYVSENGVVVAPRLKGIPTSWYPEGSGFVKNIVFAPETRMFNKGCISSFSSVEELYLICARSISDYAFVNLPSLTRVVFGSRLQRLGEFAFYQCDKLKNVFYHGTTSQWKAINKADSWVNQAVDIICYDGTIKE